jgi:short-subunit dehydrogenase
LIQNVNISVLCPGPVKTRFEEKSGAKFNVSSLRSDYVAKYCVKKMFKNKLEIVPGIKIKLAHVFSHIVPKKMISKVLRKQSEIKD